MRPDLTPANNRAKQPKGQISHQHDRAFNKRLRQIAHESFTEAEILMAAFDLGADRENLNEDSKLETVMAVISWAQRQDLIPDLVASLKETNPRADWAELEGERSIPVQEQLARFLASQADGAAAAEVQITMTAAVGGFEIALSGPIEDRAIIPLTRPEIDQLVRDIEQAWHDVVYQKVNDERIYQTRLSIPAVVNDHVLPELAAAGADFFNALFFTYTANPNSMRLGNNLRELSRTSRLEIQIYSPSLLIPWAFIYVGDDLENPEPEYFWGFRHIIAHSFAVGSEAETDPEISVPRELIIDLNVNEDIDTQMGTAIVKRQIDLWRDLATRYQHLKLNVRADVESITAGLQEPTTSPRIMYLCVHAERLRSRKGGELLENVRMLATGYQELTVIRLARHYNSFGNPPLVVFNSGQSTARSLLYYFHRRHVRATISVAIELPALLAEEWHNRFFRLFLSGYSVGEVILALNQQFVLRHNNILGLLYSVYGSHRTRLSRPVLQGDDLQSLATKELLREAGAAIEGVIPRSRPITVAEPAPFPAGARVINIEILDNDYEKIDTRYYRLRPGQQYTVSVFVRDEMSDASILPGPVLLDIGDAAADGVDFDLHIHGRSYGIDVKTARLTIPQTGRSKKARFDIVSPEEPGETDLSIVLAIAGAVVEVLTFSIEVG